MYMNIYTTSEETYRLLYTYRLPLTLSGSVKKIIDFHIRTKQDDSHLLINERPLLNETILSVVELIPTPLYKSIKIITGIEGVKLRLDLLNSSELNEELKDFEDLHLAV